MYQCKSCYEDYDELKGVICLDTTSFYSLLNCQLTREELIELAKEYDLKNTDKILEEINYNDPDVGIIEI